MGCQIRRHWRREFCSRSIHLAPRLRLNPPKLAPVFAAPDTEERSAFSGRDSILGNCRDRRVTGVIRIAQWLGLFATAIFYAVEESTRRPQAQLDPRSLESALSVHWHNAARVTYSLGRLRELLTHRRGGVGTGRVSEEHSRGREVAQLFPGQFQVEGCPVAALNHPNIGVPYVVDLIRISS